MDFDSAFEMQVLFESKFASRLRRLDGVFMNLINFAKRCLIRCQCESTVERIKLNPFG